MATSELFLIAMLIIFTVPYLIWRCFRTDYYAPLVLVQIIGGILLGPGVLGAVVPEYYSFVFTPAVIGALNGIAWWAVMIFVFVAGIELDIRLAWKHRAETGITAGVALGMPLLFGCIAAVGLLAFDQSSEVSKTSEVSPDSFPAGWIGPSGAAWQFVLGLGMACAVTALPILVLLMEKLEILRQPLGQRILRYASIDDIAIWGVLALILLDWNRVGFQAGFLVAFAGAAFLIRKLMRQMPEKDRWYIALIWLAASGFAADWSGLHFMVGAFLAGAVLDADMFDQQQMDTFRGNILLAMMPVFFLSTGLRTKWDVGGLAVFGVAAVLLVASVVGKLVGIQIAGKVLKWQKGEASIIGWLLQTKALIMIIFVNILLDKGIISNETFTATLLMAVASTMLSIPIVAPKLAKYYELLLMHGNADAKPIPAAPQRANSGLVDACRTESVVLESDEG
jgi:Kef-type K+ transport system membrane component KefB